MPEISVRSRQASDKVVHPVNEGLSLVCLLRCHFAELFVDLEGSGEFMQLLGSEEAHLGHQSTKHTSSVSPARKSKQEDFVVSEAFVSVLGVEIRRQIVIRHRNILRKSCTDTACGTISNKYL